uniref:YARHG domain-containing protein n=1 Tax=Eubacterium cellulosolvens TaxID=29322 RepID=UPI00138B142B|nr:YARHG domain-containing protein [[Eubacterium] cellulosolvens]
MTQKKKNSWIAKICPVISLVAGMLAIGLIYIPVESADHSDQGRTGGYYENGYDTEESTVRGSQGKLGKGETKWEEDETDDLYESSDADSADDREPTKEPTREPTKEPTRKPTQAPEQGQILPESSSRYLSVSDVQHLSQNEIQTAINEIYARHGYIFETPEILSYFKQFDWYHPSIPKSSFSTSLFSDVETRNLSLLTAQRR